MPSGHSYRVIKDKQHLLLLDRLEWAYTTSANLSYQPYDETFAREHADVVIEPLNSVEEPSPIYLLGNQSLKRIR